MRSGRDRTDWGPNRRFRYPRRGGTGAIWRALAKRLPQGAIHFHREVVEIDTSARRLRCADGSRHRYDALISTMPLDRLLGSLTDRPDLRRRTGSFLHSSVHLVGLGFEGRPPPGLRGKNWIYFPEPAPPCYRASVLSSYSPHNVPRPGRQWSLLCETSASRFRRVEQTGLGELIEGELRRQGLLSRGGRVVSRWSRRLEYGYPTPFVGRDRLLAEIEPELREMGIWSRGRFGSWKYEVSNQDHSLMLGVEAVDDILGRAQST